MSTLQVNSVPSYIDQDEFSRLFLQLQGCQGCRLMKDAKGQSVGMVEFMSPEAANNARNVYNGWQGWSNDGLVVAFAGGGAAAAGQRGLPLKRGRPEDEAPPDSFKQMRGANGSAVGGPGGFGGGPASAFSLSGGGVGPMGLAADPRQGGGGGPSLGDLPGGIQPHMLLQAQQVIQAQQALQQQQQQQPMASQGFKAEATPQPGQQRGPGNLPSPATVGSLAGLGGAMNSGGPQGASSNPSGALHGISMFGAAQGPGQGAPSQLGSQQGSSVPGGGQPLGAGGLGGGGQGGQGPTGQQGLLSSGFQQMPQGGQMPGNLPLQTSTHMGPQSLLGQLPSGAPLAQAGFQQQQPQPQQQQQAQGPFMQPQGGLPAQQGPQGQFFNPAAMQQPMLQPQMLPGPGQYGMLQQQQQPQPQQGNPLMQPQQAFPQGQGQLFQQPGQMQPQGQMAPLQQGGYSPGPPLQQGPYGQPQPLALQQPQQGMGGAFGGPMGGPMQLQQPGMLPQPAQPQDTPLGLREEDLPHDACRTLYVDGLPTDSTQREISHIFRPFEGFQELRLVSKTDPKGRILTLAFAQFGTTFQATNALRMVQGYQLDLDDEVSPKLRLSYARPKPDGRSPSRFPLRRERFGPGPTGGLQGSGPGPADGPRSSGGPIGGPRQGRTGFSDRPPHEDRGSRGGDPRPSDPRGGPRGDLRGSRGGDLRGDPRGDPRGEPRGFSGRR